MMKSITKSKIAISVESDLVDAAKAMVDAGRASSVSAYIAEALEEKLAVDDSQRFFDELLDESGGPITQEERDWADGLLS